MSAQRNALCEAHRFDYKPVSIRVPEGAAPTTSQLAVGSNPGWSVV